MLGQIKTVPALHSQGSVPRQGWDRGAQKSFALQNLRAEPRPSKEGGSRGNTALSDLLIIVGRDGRGSQDPKPGKGGSYRSRNETEEEERGWRPELGGWTPMTSSTSSCDTPCCWGDRELGHLSQSRSVIRTKALSAPPHDGEQVLGPIQFRNLWVLRCRDGETHTVQKDLRHHLYFIY